MNDENEVTETSNPQELEKTKLKKAIHDLINTAQDEFRRTVCRWVIESQDYGEFAAGIGRVYRELAEFVQAKLDTKKVKLSGYVSAKEWIESAVRVDYPLDVRDYDTVYLDNICETFFRRIKEDFQNQSAYLAYMVYFGVPLYTLDKVQNQYKQLEEESEIYSYLRLKGKFYEGSDYKQILDWGSDIYINTNHVEWHYKLDNDGSYPEDEGEARIKLRAAYRQMIGVPLTIVNKDSYGAGSRLYKIMQQVLGRYYGNQFDANDSDTWPKQKVVVEWLRQEHGLSDREALAIDIVTRPDEARKR